jgi:RNA-directed DNA polymerase
MKDSAQRELPFDAAESETLGMRGNSMRENRERPETSAPDGGAGRSEKAQRLKSDMHVSGKSDDLIVPTKRANKVGQPAAAESVEGRGSTKGNDLVVGRVPDAEPGGRVDRLEAVRLAARRDRKARFTALLHHVTPELLQASFFALKRQAAPGVDGVTWDEHAQRAV